MTPEQIAAEIMQGEPANRHVERSIADAIRARDDEARKVIEVLLGWANRSKELEVSNSMHNAVTRDIQSAKAWLSAHPKEKTE